MLLVQLLIASFVLFGLAHLLFFNLYFPSRYVKWTVPLAVSISAGLVLAILTEEITRRIRPSRWCRRLGPGNRDRCVPDHVSGAFPGEAAARPRNLASTAYLRSSPRTS